MATLKELKERNRKALDNGDVEEIVKTYMLIEEEQRRLAYEAGKQSVTGAVEPEEESEADHLVAYTRKTRDGKRQLKGYGSPISGEHQRMTVGDLSKEEKEED